MDHEILVVAAQENNIRFNDIKIYLSLMVKLGFDVIVKQFQKRSKNIINIGYGFIEVSFFIDGILADQLLLKDCF